VVADLDKQAPDVVLHGGDLATKWRARCRGRRPHPAGEHSAHGQLLDAAGV
jgi:hypothetical protein